MSSATSVIQLSVTELCVDFCVLVLCLLDGRSGVALNGLLLVVNEKLVMFSYCLFFLQARNEPFIFQCIKTFI